MVFQDDFFLVNINEVALLEIKLSILRRTEMTAKVTQLTYYGLEVTFLVFFFWAVASHLVDGENHLVTGNFDTRNIFALMTFEVRNDL